MRTRLEFDMRSSLPVRLFSAGGALLILFILTVSTGCAPINHEHPDLRDHKHAEQTDQIVPADPRARHTIAVLSVSEDPDHYPVEQHPEHLVLNSINGDTVQWYAAGADFDVDLGPNHPFDTEIQTIEITRGNYSQVLRFANPGVALGSDYEDYGDYSVRKHDEVIDEAILVTSHPEVIFDP